MLKIKTSLTKQDYFESETDVPLIPKEYLGKYKKGCGYTNTLPREWTKKEIDWVKELLNIHIKRN